MPRKTFYVEILCWIEADTESVAESIAESVVRDINKLRKDYSAKGQITSATLNSVEEQESE